MMLETNKLYIKHIILDWKWSVDAAKDTECYSEIH